LLGLVFPRYSFPSCGGRTVALHFFPKGFLSVFSNLPPFKDSWCRFWLCLVPRRFLLYVFGRSWEGRGRSCLVPSPPLILSCSFLLRGRGSLLFGCFFSRILVPVSPGEALALSFSFFSLTRRLGVFPRITGPLFHPEYATTLRGLRALPYSCPKTPLSPSGFFP